MFKYKRVIVGMSGGIDSAVAALLLKNKGYDVHGVFMQNWDITDEIGHCSADADFKDASFICDKLGIGLSRINFVKQYWTEVFSHMLREYETGFTPNPDILCNRNIKFKYFYQIAVNSMKADAIATGHYAKTSFGPHLEHYKPNENVKLYRAKDSKKDQMFFLCQVTQEALRKTMFPLGDLMKSEVKQIAVNNGLEKIASKKESMGICFIGSRYFQDFISEYIADKPGDFVDIETGKVVGHHRGIHQWTLGQRAKLQGLPEAYFTARKDVENNIIYVAQGSKHPILHTYLVFTEKPHWIDSQPNDLENGCILECQFKFQHSEHWTDCQVCEVDKGLIIKLSNYKRAITPGQYAVLLKGNECLGSAKISNTGVSNFSRYYLQNNKINRNIDDCRTHNSLETNMKRIVSA